MADTSYAPKPREGTGLWLIKTISGLLVIVLLMVHFIVNHYAIEGELLTWEGVVAYFANPWVVVMEITFLTVVVSHALVGLRSVILDLNPSGRVMAVIDRVLVVVGLAALVYGIWLALEVASFSV